MFSVELNADKTVKGYQLSNYYDYCAMGYKNDPTRVFIQRTDFDTEDDLIRFINYPLKHYVSDLGFLEYNLF